MKRTALLPTLVLTALAAPLALSCSPSAAGGSLVASGTVVDPDALADVLQPRAGEKALLVNFWATWCPPCVKEMPELQKLHENWKNKGVRVQTIALDVVIPQNDNDTAAEIMGFMEQRGFDLPTLIFDGDLRELSKRYQLTGSLPTTLVIDATGEVVARREGMGNYETFERMVKKAL